MCTRILIMLLGILIPAVAEAGKRKIEKTQEETQEITEEMLREVFIRRQMDTLRSQKENLLQQLAAEQEKFQAALKGCVEAKDHYKDVYVTRGRIESQLEVVRQGVMRDDLNAERDYELALQRLWRANDDRRVGVLADAVVNGRQLASAQAAIGELRAELRDVEEKLTGVRSPAPPLEIPKELSYVDTSLGGVDVLLPSEFMECGFVNVIQPLPRW